MGLWGALGALHAVPVLGGGSARVLVGTLFLSTYAGWTSMPAVHHLYVQIVAETMVPHGDAYEVVDVESNAMFPSIRAGDSAIVDFSRYQWQEPRVGDVVAVVIPPNHVFLKRIVAQPGDAFEVAGNGVFTNGGRPRGWHNWSYPNYELEVANDTVRVNGVPLDRSLANVPLPAEWASASRLPNDCYFVLGDNLNDSEDSHDFGCVPRRAIVGKVLAAL